MQPSDCPPWDYANVPNHKQVLLPRVTASLAGLRKGSVDSLAVTADTRPIHGQFFKDLTPPKHPYFAGHYRGEEYRCLKYYNVQVGSDSSLGTHAQLVAAEMQAYSLRAKGLLAMLDKKGSTLANDVEKGRHLLMVVGAACRLFDELLIIHPYANGNGHMARFVIWSVLCRYRYYPVRWTIEPRPATSPDYIELITKHRRGIKDPLMKHILSCLA